MMKQMWNALLTFCILILGQFPAYATGVTFFGEPDTAPVVIILSGLVIISLLVAVVLTLALTELRGYRKGGSGQR
jgi:hypothetical protein